MSNPTMSHQIEPDRNEQFFLLLLNLEILFKFLVKINIFFSGIDKSCLVSIRSTGILNICTIYAMHIPVQVCTNKKF